MTQPLRIGRHTIGPGSPTYVVAELSANHGGDFDRAAAIVRAAADAGADALKLQTYTPDTITLESDEALFRIGPGTPWEGRTLHDIYGEAHTPWEWHADLMGLARECGLDCFSSPFDATAVDFLETLDVPAYKIASFELVDTGLIECVARTGKPLIMSTGMAERTEIRDALDAAQRGGANGVALLKCTSAYPSPPDALHLRGIAALRREFDVPVGLSDHTLGPEVIVAAVALGACIVERHLTLRRADGGPDAAFSLEPPEFRAMVDAIRLTEKALGEERLAPTEAERATRPFRRSLFVVRDVRAGQVLTADDIRSVRPGAGLPPKHLGEVLGKRATRDIAGGTPLGWDMVEGSFAG